MSLLSLSQSAAIPRSRQAVVLGYVVPALATAALLAILLVVRPLATYPLVLFVIPVAVSAWWGGLWPGLLATLLSVVGADYFLIPPLHTVDLQQAMPLLGFLVVGVVTSAILEAFHTTRRNLEALLAAAETQRHALAESQERLRLALAEVEGSSRQQIGSEQESRKRAESALRSTEEQLRQAQKMEAIGRLAGGVAHDFNNLLTVILSYSTLLIDRLRPGERLREDLEEIRTAGLRAAALTQQLLAFSRKQVLQPRVVDLNQVTRGMQHMIERLIGEDVQLSVRLAPDLGKVKCDPGQIEHVIMNLAVNARDAMPAGGKLLIETSMVEDGAGRQVMLAVTDTGEGMDAQTRLRVFEPFFTTKPQGKGTGLGLSTAYGIVQQSGGSLSVESERGAGATFRMLLPETHVAEETPAAAEANPVPHGGAERVLLVEDEEQVRAILRAILERGGYKVLSACNGREALQLFEAEREPIEIVITDVVMPEMSGRELVERLIARCPGLRVLFISGYNDNVIGRDGELDANVAFLQKPLTPEALLRKTREVLDAPAGRFRAGGWESRT